MKNDNLFQEYDTGTRLWEMPPSGSFTVFIQEVSHLTQIALRQDCHDSLGKLHSIGNMLINVDQTGLPQGFTFTHLLTAALRQFCWDKRYTIVYVLLVTEDGCNLTLYSLVIITFVTTTHSPLMHKMPMYML